MTTRFLDLSSRLILEPIEENLYRGRSQDVGFPKLFGGQVLGQALAAASHSVAAERLPHSLHGYFLRPGDVTLPVLYQVEPMSDGRSFSTRRVIAIQKDQPIFVCISSFQPAEIGYEHQVEMPVVPAPEDIPPEAQVMTSSEAIQIDSRLIPNDGQDPGKLHMWFRAAGSLPDDPALHRIFLAYASDYRLLTACMQPHGLNLRTEALQMASLDHAIWFHSDVKADDWLLYSTDSPWAGGARGLCRGSIFTRSGGLVASTSQEGLIRVRR